MDKKAILKAKMAKSQVQKCHLRGQKGLITGTKGPYHRDKRAILKGQKGHVNVTLGLCDMDKRAILKAKKAESQKQKCHLWGQKGRTTGTKGPF